MNRFRTSHLVSLTVLALAAGLPAAAAVHHRRTFSSPWSHRPGGRLPAGRRRGRIAGSAQRVPGRMNMRSLVYLQLRADRTVLSLPWAAPLGASQRAERRVRARLRAEGRLRIVKPGTGAG